VSGSGLVYEIDIYSGDSKLLHDMGEPALGALAEAHGLLFVSGIKGILAIDIASGKPRGLIPSMARVYSAPAAAAGRLYFAGTDGVLCSVSVDAGQGQERVEIGAPVHKAIALDTSLELLYVAGADGQVRAFDISGRHAIRPAPLWRQRVGEEIGGISAVDGIAHCTVDGTVTGLDGNDHGKQRYRVPIGGMLTAAPTRYRQWVYVGGLDGGVSCLTMS
jgi:outer membrane protein assembly factor BamB